MRGGTLRASPKIENATHERREERLTLTPKKRPAPPLPTGNSQHQRCNRRNAMKCRCRLPLWQPAPSHGGSTSQRLENAKVPVQMLRDWAMIHSPSRLVARGVNRLPVHKRGRRLLMILFARGLPAPETQ